jgi:hypothetical protein
MSGRRKKGEKSRKKGTHAASAAGKSYFNFRPEDLKIHGDHVGGGVRE